MPSRVKVQGDLFHGVVPAGAVYVGRGAPGLKASPFMNHHRVGKPCRRCGGVTHTRVQAVYAFMDDLTADPDLIERAYDELAGRDLACWCPLPSPGRADACHGAVLLGLVAEKARRRWAAGGYAPCEPRSFRSTDDVPVIGGAL